MKSTKSTYALRFKTSELAEAFKVRYEEAQQSNQIVLKRQQNQNAPKDLVPSEGASVDSSVTAGSSGSAAGAGDFSASKAPVGSEKTVGASEAAGKESSSSTVSFLGVGLVVLVGVCAVAFFVQPEATKEKVKVTVKDTLKKIPAYLAGVSKSLGLKK